HDPRLTIPMLFLSTAPSTSLDYTLSLHDALPICVWQFFPFVVIGVLARLQTIPDELYDAAKVDGGNAWQRFVYVTLPQHCRRRRSEEHTSELQSRGHLVCRLLLEKKNSTSSPNCA